MPKDKYFEAVLPETLRLLGQIDKDRYSPTYGCFDRAYWHFRIRDYPCIIPQYATLSMALLYELRDKHNSWYKNKKLKELVLAAVLFWVKVQHKDGSFDEAWPNDRSQPATAFSLFYVGLAYYVFRKYFDSNICRTVESAIKKAADYVWRTSESFGAKRGDPEVANHDGGAVAAMCVTYHITGEIKFLHRYEIMRDELLNLQTSEGWFPEYGGADIGYSSVMLFYFANIFLLNSDKKIFSAAVKLLEFLKYFIHPDYSFGGEYGSRATSFVMPSAFEVFSKTSVTSASIANAIVKGIENKTIILPGNLDDQNLCSFIPVSFLQASLLHGKNKGLEKLPFENGEFALNFSLAKLVVIRKPGYYAIISGARGGLYYLFKNKAVTRDAGYVRAIRNEILATAIYNPFAITELNGNICEILTKVRRFKPVYQNPARMIASRLFFPAMSTLPVLKKLIKRLLRKKMMFDGSYSGLEFKRTLTFADNCLQTEDSKLAGFRKVDSFNNVWSFPRGLLNHKNL